MVTARHVDIMSSSLNGERYSCREGVIIIIIIIIIVIISQT